MNRHFQRHYTVEEAQALLPRVRDYLATLRRLRARIERFQRELEQKHPNGYDFGGPACHEHVRNLAAWDHLLRQLDRQCIVIRDLDRGLVDFPSLRDGQEIFLCWEEREPEIGWWHDLESGYAGRQPL
ncbi:MAG: DUF2203 domain-containing protein [Verrucomicrobiota bacterium]|nr:DUF2203 domain-containing protein [Limisphaera sp.]MDW8382972.1 DUF2203 domain-containing protein [Verrucomicrobiota bacterium]